MKMQYHSRFNIVGHTVHQRGASLLEGIAFLGVAAIIILGAVSMLTSAFGSAQSNRALEDVTSVRTAVKKLFMTSAGYGTTSLINPLVAAKALPATLAVTTDASGNSTLMNSFGGNVAVTGMTGQFQVVYDAVPNDACIALLTASSGWSTVQVDTGNGTSQSPVPLTAATAACVGTGARTITFVAS